MTNKIKFAASAIGSFLASKLGVVYPAFLMLWLFMAVDYITGVLAAYKTGKLSSAIGVWGILKKTLYATIVCLAVAVDWIILYYSGYIGFTLPINSFFGVMAALWFIFNEFISIMENCIKLETHLPPFLREFVNTAKKIVDTTGKGFAEKIEVKDDEQ